MIKLRNRVKEKLQIFIFVYELLIDRGAILD